MALLVRSAIRAIITTLAALAAGCSAVQTTTVVAVEPKADLRHTSFRVEFHVTPAVPPVKPKM